MGPMPYRQSQMMELCRLRSHSGVRQRGAAPSCAMKNRLFSLRPWRFMSVPASRTSPSKNAAQPHVYCPCGRRSFRAFELRSISQTPVVSGMTSS